MSGFHDENEPDEYYIGINPPLLPNGVEHVLSSVRQRYPLEDEETPLMEILYEPDTAWFKCISLRSCKVEITNLIERLVHDILQEETCLVDPDEENVKDEFGNLVDLEITADEPSVLPWKTFNDKIPSEFLNEYERFVYPTVLESAPHKAVWRGLEPYPWLTLDDILDSGSLLAAKFSKPVNFDNFRRIVSCSIIQNMEMNTLYIGSTASKANVENAVQKLDNIVELVPNLGLAVRPRHAILIIDVPGKPQKLMYQWLSRVGLAERTYVPINNTNTSDEYSAILNSTTLRTARYNEDTEDWVIDQKVYRASGHGLNEPTDAFAPLSKYMYTPKVASAKDQSQTTQQLNLEHRPKKADKSPRLQTSEPLPEKQTVPMDPDVGDGSYTSGIIDAWREQVHREQPDLMTFDEVNTIQTAASKRTLSSMDDGDLLDFSQSGVTKHHTPRPGDPDYDLLGDLEKDESTLLDSDALDNSIPQFSLAKCVSPVRHSTMRQQARRRKTPQPVSPSKEGTDDNTDDPQSNQPEPTSGQLSSDNTKAPHIETPAKIQVGLRQSSSITVPQSQSEAKDKLLFKKTHVNVMREQMKEIVEILRMVPGEVQLQLKFGRIYFKGILQPVIEKHAGWDLENILGSLRENLPQETFGFQSILSTVPWDAEKIVQLKLTGGSIWNLEDVEVMYEFTCRLSGGDDDVLFKIEVDAKTFKHRCASETEEITNVFVHCPQFAWDMRACATRTHRDLPEACESFAKSLVESLSVTCSTSGDVSIKTSEDPGFDISIEHVCIRHLARYHCNPEDGRQLTITMVRPISKSLEFMEVKSKGSEQSGTQLLFCGRTKVSQKSEVDGSALKEWFEATLTSSRAQEIFNENENLEFGNKTTWTVDHLEAEGIFEDICRPAIDMISQMDEIGSSNNNRKNPELTGYDGSTGQNDFW